MKGCLKIVAIVIVAFIGLAVLVGIFGNSSDEKKSKETNVVEAAFTDKELAELDSLNEVTKQQNKEELETLKKKFIYKADEFNNTGWYYHKTWGTNWLNRSGLVCRVNAKGYIYMESQYHGDSWIFHNKAIVKIGESVYETEHIPLYSNHHHTDNNYNGVYEVNKYVNGLDNGIIYQIAQNHDKEIKVRFAGDQKIKDFTLGKQDKQAIADCSRLAQLIILNDHHSEEPNL